MSEPVLNGHGSEVRETSYYGIDLDAPVVAAGNCTYKDDYIEADYVYNKNTVTVDDDGQVTIRPRSYKYQFRTSRRVPRVGVLLVGWGGNNGSTLTAGLLANRHSTTWHTRTGTHSANYYGSLTQATTVRVGATDDGRDVHVPMTSLLPMVHPNDLVVGGWDIKGEDMGQAMERAAVLPWDLQRQLREEMGKMKPMPSIYYPDFIAANQEDRADNVVPGTDKGEHLEKIRKDIRDFKKANDLETVIVLWTANTERFVDVIDGVNTRGDDILKAIKSSHEEISPSQVFAVASILEGCPYINGSPQNTLTAGIVELAEKHGVFVAGDDFKSGQTKVKSVLVDFLVSAGIKPRSIVSYNHLGNNDGKNLQAPKQFRSKEISKSNVVDDMVAMNHILYKDGEHPDHCVVIKYVPAVGDSKRAMDEYTSDIFMNGRNTLVLHNTCEDSLLAAPLMIDLAVLAELFTRIKYRTNTVDEYTSFHPVLSALAYLCKAPLVPSGTPIVNALFKQQRCLTDILCACLGIPPDTSMLLEQKTKLPNPEEEAQTQSSSSSNASPGGQKKRKR